MSEAKRLGGGPVTARFRMWRAGSRPGGMQAALLYLSMPALSAVNAVVGLLIPRLLGPVDFGQYSLVVTMFQYGLILDFGLSQLTDRRLPVMVSQGDQTGLDAFVNEVLWTRLYVAAAVGAGGSLLMLWLDGAGLLPFSAVPGILSLAGGIGFMLALGPMSVWRATARRGLFARWSAACGLVLAVGRPVGMLAGGLSGCFGLLAAGYAGLAAALGGTMPPRRAGRPGAGRVAVLLALGAPLFATSFIWAFYMTANRWVMSLLVSETDLGQFAFGANVVYLIVGTVAALAQLHYPALVARAAAAGPFGVSRVIGRDLSGLAVAVAGPTVVGLVAGPYLIDLFYPAFSGAEGPLRGLLAAVPSLVVASWLMPLSLSTAARPWVDGVVIYPAALALLAAATAVGFRLSGIDGAGWGLVASSVPLVAMQLGRLHLVQLLRPVDAGRILGAVCACTAVLVGLQFLT